eukprot:CAMPEP_0183308914 /NCGR_PEP_ID=MMETSP0160_2-20130417/22980_1 /TAXON_ID=2839 ORGANISM="Odontella Sinensis, Strain Grunow 1884" /NCGR_SAMPLE_ID=MMETSP0160_2 /ASSEMBLY_ACC=CAM_ASM_000250 /LENGTH=32 /DNA_ID= /DNA_START= /DNA_END= /DNA_ORIENTATION=
MGNATNPEEEDDGSVEGKADPKKDTGDVKGSD